MPTYDYECKTCSHTFEAFQSMSDDALAECPECTGELRRLIGGGLGVIFKGDGFYVTDNRSGSASNGSGSDKAKEEGSSSPDAKSNSKSSDSKSSDSKSSDSKRTDGKGPGSSKEPVKS